MKYTNLVKALGAGILAVSLSTMAVHAQTDAAPGGTNGTGTGGTSTGTYSTQDNNDGFDWGWLGLLGLLGLAGLTKKSSDPTPAYRDPNEVGRSTTTRY